MMRPERGHVVRAAPFAGCTLVDRYGNPEAVRCRSRHRAFGEYDYDNDNDNDNDNDYDNHRRLFRNICTETLDSFHRC